MNTSIADKLKGRRQKLVRLVAQIQLSVITILRMKRKLLNLSFLSTPNCLVLVCDVRLYSHVVFQVI